MPRLTAKQYLRSHRQLRRFWLKQPRLFTALRPYEQWVLHDYFQPDKDVSDVELLQHRSAITLEHPSLPHQAGRALAKFQYKTSAIALQQVRRSKLLPAKAGKYRPQQDRVLSVAPLMRPEIDQEKLAAAFASLARFKLQVRQTAKYRLGRVAITSMGAGEQPPGTPTWVVGEWLINHPGLEPFAEVDDSIFDQLDEDGIDIGQ